MAAGQDRPLGKMKHFIYFALQSTFNMFRFNPAYFVLAILLVVTDFLLINRLHDAIIHPYGGDLIWGVFLYCVVRSFVNRPVVPTALAVLVFCYAEEILQYFNLADRLGFTKPSLMRTLIGTSFSWVDMLCYTLGIGVVILLESVVRKKQTHLDRATTKSL
jgi:Protein of unknown function (DUF2809)